MEKKPFLPTVDAGKLKTDEKFVFWIDIMGTQNIMSDSLAKSSNYILKLHACIAEAVKGKDKVTVYPVMDGAYITSPKYPEMVRTIKGLFANLSNIFISEPEIDHKFVVRGSLSYGEVIDGNELNEAITQDLAEDYKKRLLFGMPVIQAFLSERSAPPFGVFVHESARKYEKDYKIQGRTFKWWKDDEQSKSMCSALEQYFDWCIYNSIYLELPPEKIDSYKKSAKAYFDPQGYK